MAIKYKIHCVTENLDKFWTLENTDPAPTKCPTNTAHTVDLSSVAVVQVGDVTEVVTQREKGDKTVKLARAKADVELDGTATVSLQVPGIFLSGDGRYLRQGIIISADYNPDDYVTITLEDTSRALALYLAKQINPSAVTPLPDVTVQSLGVIPGFGSFPSYPIIKNFNDTDLSSENNGWFFVPGNSGTGTIIITTANGIPLIPSGLYLKIVYHRPSGTTNGSLRINFDWIDLN